MKNKISLLFIFFVSANFLFAQQSRNGISYQALILDSNVEELPGVNNVQSPLVNTQICLAFTILDAFGNEEYREYVVTTTDSFGMVNEIIGTGQQVSFNGWNDIVWTADSKSLMVELDKTGSCTDFELISNEVLTAVPFALYSPGSGVQGIDGKSAYEIWLDLGNTGTEQDFIDSLIGDDGDAGDAGDVGDSAYEVWLALGNTGTEQDFIDSLKGVDGTQGVDGISAYDVWLALGNTGTEQDFIDSLKGDDGEDGDDFAFELPDGTDNGDYLQWIWNGTSWDITVITPDDTTIILISSSGTNNQSVCANVPIEPISYSFSEQVTGVTVIGLPTGLTFELANNELVISGQITQQLLQTSTFEYQVQVPQSNGPNRVAYGKITFEPAPQILLDLGEQNLSSCLLEPIEPIEYLIENSQSSATITGLPSGITSTIVGNRIIIQGTPDSSLANGSSFNYTIETDPGTCTAVSTTGTLSFTDCSTCYPTAEAGADTTICSGDIFQIAGNVGNATNIFWTTSGNGTFNNPNSPNPQYVPTNEDFNAGSVTLTVKAQNDSCGSLEELEDSMVLSISDCSSIDVTLINNMEAIVFANDVTFGARIETANIQNIASAGLCYNTTGGATTADPKVEQAYYDGGFWKDTPPVFELDLIGVPVDSLFVRPFVTTIGGDTVYGNQIAIANEDPNRNHIYNFSTESGDFSPENYTINTTSEITFQNIISLNSINWSYSSPNYSDIVIVNFPNLDRINDEFKLNYEFSLREFNAPKLREVRRLTISYNTIERFLLPSLESINDSESKIFINISLIEIDLTKLENIRSGLHIFENNSLTSLSFPNLYNIYNSYSWAGLRIHNNNNLKQVTFNSSQDFIGYLRINENPVLENILFENVNHLEHADINIYNNPSLLEIEFPALISSSYFNPNDRNKPQHRIEINNNESLINIDFSSLNNINILNINNNNALNEINFPLLEIIHQSLNLSDHNSLNTINAPMLVTTGDKRYQVNSLFINSNNNLVNVDFSSLFKVYTKLEVKNNPLLDINQFPCYLFILENDGLDCTLNSFEVSGNLDDTNCFQDISLIPPIDIQSTDAYNITSDAAIVDTTIISFTKMKSRGLVWGTSQNPTVPIICEDVCSENGSLNGDFTSYLYNLQPNTTYYFRAYGEDCNGVYYGNQLTLTTPP